jgi:hypothetical protein
MEILDVVRKLVGPIQPVGDSNEDLERLASLKTLTKLVGELLKDIETAAENANSEEASVKLIGDRALKFLEDIGDEYYGNYAICSKPRACPTPSEEPHGTIIVDLEWPEY